MDSKLGPPPTSWDGVIYIHTKLYDSRKANPYQHVPASVNMRVPINTSVMDLVFEDRFRKDSDHMLTRTI